MLFNWKKLLLRTQTFYSFQNLVIKKNVQTTHLSRADAVAVYVISAADSNDARWR